MSEGHNTLTTGIAKYNQPLDWDYSDCESKLGHVKCVRYFLLLVINM